MLTENQVMRMVENTVVTNFPTASRRLGEDLPDDLVYNKGESTSVCTLILSGKMTVITGSDEFRTDVGSWTLLGIAALKDPNYQCDFQAFVCNGPCRCIQFTRENYAKALDASICEKRESKEDSFRNLELDKLKNTGQNSSAPSASEAASEADETADTSSDRGGGRRRGSRRTKLLAALSIGDLAPGATKGEGAHLSPQRSRTKLPIQELDGGKVNEGKTKAVSFREKGVDEAGQTLSKDAGTGRE